MGAAVDRSGSGKYDGFRLGTANEFIIFNTETGHAWRRSGGNLFDLGTPEKPQLDVTRVSAD